MKCYCPGSEIITILRKWCLSRTRHALCIESVAGTPERNFALLCPERLPDSNYCNYLLWSTVKGVSNLKLHNSIASLKSFIRRAWRSIKFDEAVTSFAVFRERIEVNIEANEARIQLIYCIIINKCYFFSPSMISVFKFICPLYLKLFPIYLFDLVMVFVFT